MSSLSDNVLIKIGESVTKVAWDWLKSLVGNKIVVAPLWREITNPYSSVALMMQYDAVKSHSILFYPITLKVIGAPQMTSQQSLSIVSCFQLS